MFIVGTPNDDTEINNFIEATRRARELLGDCISRADEGVQRLRAYDGGYGATNSYGEIKGDIRSPKTDKTNKSAISLASRLPKRNVTPA